LPEKKIPDCAGFLFGFKARQQAHSELCNGWRNAEAEQKDQQDGRFFDRNRLSTTRVTQITQLCPFSSEISPGES
jgi:hypothetical protein